jgi:hypothetical protein
MRCFFIQLINFLHQFAFYNKIGNRKSKFELKNTTGVDEKDEITLYIRGRMLCSMDAMWRIFGFQNYPAPQPSVIHIKPKLPSQLIAIQSEQKLCDLLVYLERPQTAQFSELKFTEFFQEWKYGYKIPTKHS